MNLSWSDVAGETGYMIQRSIDGGTTWSQVATVGANVTTYQNTGLAANTTYAYRVVANNAGGDSADSNSASGTTLSVPVLPAAPSALKAAALSATQVNPSWSDNATNETGFRVERSSNGGKSWSQIAQVGTNVRSFVDTTVNGGKTYSYRVRAFNDGGNSAYSNLAKLRPPAHPR